MWRHKYNFCVQLVQDVQRFHFLFRKRALPQFKQEYAEHRVKYLERVINSNNQLLMQNALKDSDTPDELTKRLVHKYLELFGKPYLNANIRELIINENTIYDEVYMGCEKTLIEYELSKIEIKRVPLEKLFKYLKLYRKMNIQEAPLNTLNILHNELGFTFDLHQIVLHMRTCNQFTALPLSTIQLILSKLPQEYDLTLQCLQQIGHSKVKVNLQNIIDVMQKQIANEFLLELVRTINILRANGYAIKAEQLLKVCSLDHNIRQFGQEREFNEFMGRPHETKAVILNSKSALSTLTDLLMSKTEINKGELKPFLSEILQTATDDVTIKKAMLVACKYFDTDIQVIARAGRAIRPRLENHSSQTLSLVVNALHQFHRVQYPLLNKQFYSYLAAADLYELNVQEINCLLFVICETLPKQTRKELMGLGKPQQLNKDILTILENLSKKIMRLCTLRQFRIKVLFTAIDCYAKYNPKIDLKLLFEKIEYNLMEEMHLKYKCGVYLDKDIAFLQARFRYLHVGSRKLHRFFAQAKVNYRKAMKIYISRLKVYTRMKDRRTQAMRAAAQF